MNNVTPLFKGESAGTVKVLLVDDQPIFRSMARSMLEKDPAYQVIGEATCGSEAIEMTGEMLPDIVVMDVQMPDMSGMEACRTISSRFPKVEIVLMSMGSDSEYPALARAVGASGFLTKREVTPVNLARILSDGEQSLAA